MLRRLTPARVGLGRVGCGLPTAAMLDFQLAHANARDAVATRLDAEALAAGLGWPSMILNSAAPDQDTYLRRPDLGRRLAQGAGALVRGDCDLAIVIADGLSATAAQKHAVPVVQALVADLGGWSIAPAAIVRRGRVAIGDEIGERLGVRAVVVLIGERPGLSAADSLGAYVTWAPRVGRLDSERNCVSNIRSDGLPPEAAARKIAWLLGESRRLGFTGVDLKNRETPALGEVSLDRLPARNP
ncbi:MAG: ethanolamine ammonia-lyase subunit EutC [Caulobacteraceae bacterium]|nr:ethanolamine ammonia-lyase subunit EutC [Caulobacteraceae bacterium]